MANQGPAPGITALFKTTQFAWFLGHCTCLTGALIYALYAMRVFKAPSFPIFWYRTSFVAAILTYGIILNETYKQKRMKWPLLLQDDNVHYLMISFMWLYEKPFFGTLPPFIVYSLFHVLTYSRSYVLPHAGFPSSSRLANQINTFINRYNDPLMMFAASSEIFLLMRLAVLFMTFRKGTTVPFIVYFMFIKFRYDQSQFTQTAIRAWEVRINNLVAGPNTPFFLKNVWLGFREVVKTYIGPILRPHSVPSADRYRSI
ncbi:pore membrane protein of 33 kDa [Trichomonascus vanleenenianus]|uniref:pore membrane protein of 33 kDa n=1 Tax=Trichomonascus vanleenenianus TaxID=2268995 RepID=UPI003EC9BDCE